MSQFPSNIEISGMAEPPVGPEVIASPEQLSNIQRVVVHTTGRNARRKARGARGEVHGSKAAAYTTSPLMYVSHWGIHSFPREAKHNVGIPPDYHSPAIPMSSSCAAKKIPTSASAERLSLSTSAFQ